MRFVRVTSEQIGHAGHVWCVSTKETGETGKMSQDVLYFEKKHSNIKRCHMEETGKAQAALADYLALGPSRSLAKLCQKLGKSEGYIGQLERWSSQYGWVARAKQHDAEVAQERQQKREEAIDEMNREQSAQGRVLRNKSYERILELMAAPRCSLYALSQILKISVDMERDSIEGDELQRRIEMLENLMKERSAHD